MVGQSSSIWVPVSLRTPGILIFGMVMAPCGWVLDLTATVASSWRTLNSLQGVSSGSYIQEGLWDVCLANTVSASPSCGQTDASYRATSTIPIFQGLMVASLIVTLIGLCVAIPGVRCWKDRPNWIVSSLGGLLIFCSGVLTIIPISWFNYIYKNITSDYSTADVRLGYCIYLGYIGGICEVLGGIVMTVGFCRCCGGRNRGERRVEEIRPRYNQQNPPSRPTFVPRSTRPRSSASSVPYSKNMDDDVSFPRAKSPAAGSVNSAFSNRPYDADL